MASFVVILTFLISARLMYAVLKKFFVIFSEYYILWSVARGGNPGGSRTTVIPRNRLLIFVCHSDRLDEKSVEEIYSFVGQHVNYAVDVQAFHRLLLSYRYAVLYRDIKDGSLRGMSMINVEKKMSKTKGKQYIIMQIGVCYFDRKYRGGSYKHFVLAYFRLNALLSHPFTPFLMVAEYFNYKPYAQLAHALKNVYPSFGKKTPEFMKEFIDDFAFKNLSEKDEYNPETFVLKKENFYYLKKHVTESWAADLKDPHVRFFFERNPGWEKGHRLVAAASVKLWDLLILLLRISVKVKKERRQLKIPKLLRRVSFQSEHANECASKMSRLSAGKRL